jgi:hypothetical protein
MILISVMGGSNTARNLKKSNKSYMHSIGLMRYIACKNKPFLTIGRIGFTIAKKPSKLGTILYYSHEGKKISISQKIG